MAKQCRVVRNNEGQIISVKDEQGEDSSLFNSLNNIIKEPNISLEYYAITETDDFLEVNGTQEPTAKEIFEFSNSSEKTPLTNQEISEVQNAMLSTGFFSSTDLYEKLYNVLVNKNGIVTFDESRLKTMYNDFEVSRIMSSPELQQTIKQSFLKLKNTPEIAFDYNRLFVIPSSVTLNILGKQVSSNPYVLEKEIDSNIGQELSPGVSDKYATNTEFKQVIDEKTKTLKNVPLLTTVDGELVQKEDNIKNYLQDIVISEANNSLTEDIAFLATYPINKWEQNRTDIQEIIENVVERAKDNGIDLRDFAIRTQTMSREEIISFLGSMENVLENPIDENITEFADTYNNVLKATAPLQSTIISQNEFDSAIETSLTEYEMLRDFNMIKKADGVYRKVVNQNLEQLYYNYFQNNNHGFNSVEEFTTYVQQEGIQKLNVTDFEIDTDVLEKMYLYKTHFGFPLNTESRIASTENLSNITIDEDYLKDQFVREMNRFVLQTENRFFTVNEKGINISSNDPITTTESLFSLPIELIEPLAQYNALSKNLHIDLQPSEPIFSSIDNKLSKRQEAVNNPQSVPKLTGEYTYLEDGVMAVKNENKDFVRTPNGIYEMIFEQGNIKFYGQLPQSNSNYKIANIDAPLSDIDFNNYQYLNTTPEVFKQAKNFYTKQELEQINQENFNCQ